MLDPVNPHTPPPPSAPVDPRLGLAELKEKKSNSGADAIKKFTPSLGLPYLEV